MRTFSFALIVAMSFSLWSYATGQTKPCEAANVPPHSPPRNMGVFSRPPFYVEFERDRKGGTRFVLTNQYQVPLTAYVEEITPVPDEQQGGVEHRFHVVDALIRSGELLSPIPENLSTMHYVSHNLGREDAQPSVAAVVWEDGLTYGPQELIQKVIARRRLSSLYHQHAIDLLQTGLKEGWDANRYVAEGRSHEEGSHVMEVDAELDIIIEFPLAVVVDNLMQVRRDNPGNADRAAKMMLERELKEKAALDSGLSAMENPAPSVPRICAK